jgi:hypothetical protein
MSFIPDKHLFIVTSALNTGLGVINNELRFEQTLQGVKSLREKAPEAIIFLADGSPQPVDDILFEALGKYTSFNLAFRGDPDLCTLANAGLKSQAEVILLHKTLSLLKSNQDLSKMMASVKRVYKFSGRTDVVDGFDIARYDDPALYGKYTFKTRIPSWMPTMSQAHSSADHLLITRLYSWCASLTDDYLATLMKIYEAINVHGIDTEHAHYREINKKYLVEFDNLYCQGTMASTGLVEVY